MISRAFSASQRIAHRGLLRQQRAGVHDWSHIYDGIYKFEDNSIGEDLLDLRNQALDFAKKKISPYALDWEKEAYFPVETFREAAEIFINLPFCFPCFTGVLV